MCFTTGYVQGSDLSKMMLSSNSLSWPEPVKKKLPQATVKEFFVVQHGALAEELAHMAEVGVLFQTHTSSCASCAGSCCPVPPL